MTADIVDIATDLKALEKKPGAFDPVCLRLRFERDEGLEESQDGLAERFIVVSFEFVFLFMVCSIIYLELLIALNF